MWTTQAQINEEVQDEIQEINIALQWVGDQLIDLEKQALLKNALATEIVDVTKVKYTDAQGKSKTLLTFKGSTRT